MVKYQESRTSSGDLAAMQYGHGAEVGKSTHSGTSQTVRPSVSDFICDVEVSARRVLDQYQLTYFKRYYVIPEIVVLPFEEIELEGDRFLEAHLARYSESRRAWIASLDYSMRLTLGKRFEDVNLFPIDTYMKSVDVRCPRQPKIRWSHLY